MPLTPKTLFPDFEPLSCLCLDAEFASSRDILEMLELTMIDSEGTVIYNHRFNPARMRRWNLVPHGIKPSMVKDEPSFASCRPSIQRILNHTDYLVGFAVENDLRRLEAQGTKNLDDRNIIEIRDWFWYIYGRDHGLDYARDIGLARCCAELGVEQDPERAHSAEYDTLVTLRCFHVLLEMFVNSHPDEHFDSFGALYDLFMTEFGKAKEAYDLEAARGYCTICHTGHTDGPNMYRFSATREAPDPARPGFIASIQVANRRKAVIDLSKMLTGSMLTSTNFTFRRLTDPMLDRFRKYTNAADIDELNMARNLMKLSKAFPQTAPRRN